MVTSYVFSFSFLLQDCSLRKVQDTPPQQLLPVFDSLNQLSSIPWTINSAILDIVIEVFMILVPYSLFLATSSPGVVTIINLHLRSLFQLDISRRWFCRIKCSSIKFRIVSSAFCRKGSYG